MRLRLDPIDEYLHELGPETNFNESMYFNVYDPASKVGAFFRLGNRANEGTGEMTICVYLPDGRVGFMFKRPEVRTNDAFDAAGMTFEVIEPFEHLRVTYTGKLVLLDDPLHMADPRAAFTSNPYGECTATIDYTRVSDMFGGEPEEAHERPGEEFAKGHYEQLVRGVGSITVDGVTYPIDGYGLRDHSWGPRIWQSIWWYRWVTASFPDFGIGATLRGEEGDPSVRHSSGYVYDRRSGQLVTAEVTDLQLDTEYDDEWFPVRNHAVITTDRGDVYELHGEIWSAIPLRNRRDGNVTRISESMTRFRCGDAAGAGFTEYLDQIVDGRPVGVGIGG